MNRRELQALAHARIKDAQALYRSGRYDGAYYVAGYAVECALKACIAKRTKRYEFPDKEIANKVFTHDLIKLLELAELTQQFEQELKKDAGLVLNWGYVKNWNEKSRYQAHGREGKEKAKNVIEGVTAVDGVLECLKKYW